MDAEDSIFLRVVKVEEHDDDTPSLAPLREGGSLDNYLDCDLDELQRLTRARDDEDRAYAETLFNNKPFTTYPPTSARHFPRTSEMATDHQEEVGNVNLSDIELSGDEGNVTNNGPDLSDFGDIVVTDEDVQMSGALPPEANRAPTPLSSQNRNLVRESNPAANRAFGVAYNDRLNSLKARALMLTDMNEKATSAHKAPSDLVQGCFNAAIAQLRLKAKPTSLQQLSDLLGSFNELIEGLVPTLPYLDTTLLFSRIKAWTLLATATELNTVLGLVATINFNLQMGLLRVASFQDYDTDAGRLNAFLKSDKKVIDNRMRELDELESHFDSLLGTIADDVGSVVVKGQRVVSSLQAQVDLVNTRDGSYANLETEEMHEHLLKELAALFKEDSIEMLNVPTYQEAWKVYKAKLMYGIHFHALRIMKELHQNVKDIDKQFTEAKREEEGGVDALVKNEGAPTDAMVKVEDTSG